MLSRVLASLCVLFCVSAPLRAATVQYSSRQDIATNFQKLTGIAVADFNGDGKLDIAVTDVYTQQIVVYLNTGNGTFGAPITTTLNVSGIGGLGALVAGDVNEDGKQDLIVGPVAGNQVDVVLIGNGDGTFTQGEFVPGSYGFSQASLIDINGDSHLDLVSAANGNTYVALGDGKGNFTNANAVQAPSDIFTALTVGDFNNDKHLDFVTAAYQNNELNVFLGVGDGTFQTPSTIQPANVYNPLSLASADFNNDGKRDLVVGSANVASLIFGNGDGTFQTSASEIVSLPLAYVAGVSSTTATPPLVASADMNGDGNADIVAADNTFDMLTVLLNDGTGTFPPATQAFTAALDAGSGNLQLADLNGDGLPDIIVTNYITQNISIFLSVVPKATPTIAATSSALQALVGSSPTITVQVSGVSPNTPSGTVALSNGGTPLGVQTLNASGQATFTLVGLTAGQYSLSAAYSGDAHYGALTETTITQDITDFQLSLPAATQTVQAGASATFPLSLSAQDGFTGSVAISCSGLPTGYTCSPSTTTLSTASATVNVVVAPPATTGRLDSWPGRPASRYPFVFLACAGLCLYSSKRRRMLPLATVLLSITCFGAFTGCSSGSGSGSTSPTPTPYTGTSTFTITAVATQGSITSSHQITATLIVQ